MNLEQIFADRQRFSEDRLEMLERRLSKDAHTKPFVGDLTIFAAGSYGRLEASRHSDLDLFFIYRPGGPTVADPKTKEFRLFGSLIGIADEMGFQAFSNDAQYLHTINCSDLLSSLGSPADDARNYFTLRLLMLLESKPVFGREVFTEILTQIFESYYRDYPDHQATFKPWFLLNDIARFWKTLLLNYENKRNQTGGDVDRDKQRVRNFKLKYSRLTTCFATIVALGTADKPVTVPDLMRLVDCTPRQRLELAAERVADLIPVMEAILRDYAWFLEQTALTEEDLRALFKDKGSRVIMFQRANEYSALMYDALKIVDAHGLDEGHGSLLKYLVI